MDVLVNGTNDTDVLFDAASDEDDGKDVAVRHERDVGVSAAKDGENAAESRFTASGGTPPRRT